MIYFFFFQAPVPPGPVLSVTPSALTFSTPVGVNPASQNLSIANLNPGALAWSRTVAGAGLSAVPSAGSTPSVVTVSLNVAGLLPGIYNGNVTVTAPGASGSPLIVPVTLTVTAAAATLGVNPLVLAFAAQIGTTPPAQTVTVVNLGPGTFVWTATPVGSGVSVAPTTGSPPGSFQVSIDTTGMGVGVHNRSVVVSTVP